MIRLILAGELDLAFRPTFETAVADAQVDSDRVLLDLQALTLIDCANLAVVFSAAERGRHEGSVLILQSPRGQVRRVLDLLGAPPGVAVLDHEELRPQLLDRKDEGEDLTDRVAHVGPGSSAFDTSSWPD